MTPLSQKHIKDIGLCKKKIKDAYPKKVNSYYPKRKEKERWSIQWSSYTIHQKYPHTCTSWSWFMTCFSFGSSLWLSKIWEAGLPLYPPYLQIHQKEATRSRMEKKGTQKGLGEEWNTFERFERSPEELTKKFFQKLFETFGLTVEQRSG